LSLEDCTTDGNISYGIVQPGQAMDDGVPIIRVQNVNNGTLNLSEVMKISPKISNNYKRTILKGGEVLLTLVGSTGQSVVAPIDVVGWNVARAIAVIKPKPEIGANWINIYLQSGFVRHYLEVRANTTVQKTLNLKDVRSVPIPIPPDDIKRSIESIAMSISNKTAINNQINKTLEEMAQAVFKSWFVDFEPVRAKAAALAAGRTLDDANLAAMRAISGKRLRS
jgi:type I restriction enzyme S subunit